MNVIRSIIIKKEPLAGIKLVVKRGKPIPFGAERNGETVNFSLFSKNGTSVHLVISHPESTDILAEIQFDSHWNKTGHIWHMEVEGLPAIFCYNFRVGGTFHPDYGKFFNADNLLIDPYSKALVGGEIWGQEFKKTGIQEVDRNICSRRSLMPYVSFNWEDDKPLNIPLKNSIIYELHVRGFSIHKSAGVANPGTFDAIVEKIPYFKELGITALELMPINEFDENECMFSDPLTGEKLKNFWGYSSYGFFAPKASYAASAGSHGQVNEFRNMVKELHKAKIEVILDVVFNHTAEGNQEGPTICFRGLENEVYYMMDKGKYYKNFSGCGNTLNCNHPVVREMILDCLRYWVTEMHVDGFRFDLASILGRSDDGSVMPNPPVLEAIAKDPVLAETKIIAEAWDAAGLYQVGNFPAWNRWAEWNDKYRDGLRRFVCGEKGVASEAATRIAGSSDLYGESGRKPYHSVNYITCHDGFTMNDLVTYNEKSNIRNGENNRDGQHCNYSWNCGQEGPSKKEGVKKLRKRQIKNFFALLFVSQGTPMILAGDEFGRTQNGNNNAYCQDNEIGWVDWSLLEKNKDILEFVKSMIQFRKENIILRRDNFFTGKKPFEQSLPDISWHGRKPEEPDFSEESTDFAFLLSGVELHTHTKYNDIYVAANMGKRSHTFKLPVIDGHDWYLKCDTHEGPSHDFYQTDDEPLLETQKSINVRSHSVVILISKEKCND